MRTLIAALHASKATPEAKPLEDLRAGAAA
jgi:hypothetical protein